MSTTAKTDTKPKAYQLTYEELAPDMKRFAGVWVVPEGADDPFEAEMEEIRLQQLEEDRRLAERETKAPAHLRGVMAS